MKRCKCSAHKEYMFQPWHYPNWLCLVCHGWRDELPDAEPLPGSGYWMFVAVASIIAFVVWRWLS